MRDQPIGSTHLAGPVTDDGHLKPLVLPCELRQPSPACSRGKEMGVLEVNEGFCVLRGHMVQGIRPPPPPRSCTRTLLTGIMRITPHHQHLAD